MALWLLGEYCVDAPDVACAFTTLKTCLGELPFVLSHQVRNHTRIPLFTGNPSFRVPTQESEVDPDPAPQAQARPVVLADGTYAAQVLGRSSPPTPHLPSRPDPSNSRAMAARVPAAHWGDSAPAITSHVCFYRSSPLCAARMVAQTPVHESSTSGATRHETGTPKLRALLLGITGLPPTTPHESPPQRRKHSASFPHHPFRD